MSYILIVDDEADIRDIYEMVLRRAFMLEIVGAQSGNKAIEIIKRNGVPEIIISDLRMPDGDGHALYKAIQDNNWNVPFVISSSESVTVLKKKFPNIAGYIEKPNIIGPVVEIVESVLGKNKVEVDYVPIRISLLLRWGSANYDLFMKLSDSRFVKVIKADEAFIPSDAERFFSKNIQHLYITSTDADAYLKNFEANITMVLNSESSSSADLTVLTLESLESVERIASTLGWTPQVLEAAKHAVNLAIKAVCLEPNILKLFKQKLSDPTSKYSSHVSLLSLLTCGIAHQLGWVSESTQMKLGLAALLHDLTLDESVYQDIFLWNQAASDLTDKTPEVQKYRNHPIEAANLVLAMKNLPSDVDQIILQHHEMKDGTGFPRGLITSRITPLACVFIIVEDLINFMEESKDFDQKINLFIKHRENKYSSGNFKKVFDAFQETVDKTRLGL